MRIKGMSQLLQSLDEIDVPLQLNVTRVWQEWKNIKLQAEYMWKNYKAELSFAASSNLLEMARAADKEIPFDALSEFHEDLNMEIMGLVDLLKTFEEKAGVTFDEL